jgi:hypothetical protein
MTNPHIGSLDAAREQLVKQRRQLVEELAKPWVRGKTDDFRESFVKVQQAIAAIDEALKDEKSQILTSLVSPRTSAPTVYRRRHATQMRHRSKLPT